MRKKVRPVSNGLTKMTKYSLLLSFHALNPDIRWILNVHLATSVIKLTTFLMTNSLFCTVKLSLVALIFSSQSNFFCNFLFIRSFLRWLYSPNGKRFFECALKEHWFFSVKRGQSAGINIQTYRGDVKLKSYGFRFSNKLRQTKKTAREKLTMGTLQERQVRYFLLQSCSNYSPLLQPRWLHDTLLESLCAEQVENARLEAVFGTRPQKYCLFAAPLETASTPRAASTTETGNTTTFSISKLNPTI